MAELLTLARPYAKAAFDYAHEQGVVGDWEDFLFIASTVVHDAAFADLLDNPAIPATQKVTALVDIYDTQVAGKAQTALKQLLANSASNAVADSAEQPKVSAALNNFLQQLAEQNRLPLLPEIYKHFRQHKSQALKQMDAYVTTAYPLTEAQRLLIRSRLASSLNASILLHETVDPSLIAGATIKIGDKIVDDSVRGKLKQLKTQLTA